MLARNTCWLEPSACTPTLLPFRSVMVRMRSLREQLEAAGMHAGQHRDRLARVDRDQERRREVHAEIDLAARRSSAAFVDARLHAHIADIGEAFGAQQLLGDVLRREADAGSLGDPDRGRFRRPLVGERCRGRQARRGAGHGRLARKSRRLCMICIEVSFYQLRPARRAARLLTPSARA